MTLEHVQGFLRDYSNGAWPDRNERISQRSYVAQVVETRIARLLGTADPLYVAVATGKNRQSAEDLGAVVFAKPFIIFEQGAGPVDGADATGGSLIVRWSDLTGVTLKSAFERPDEADGGLVFDLHFKGAEPLKIVPSTDKARLQAPELLDFVIERLSAS